MKTNEIICPNCGHDEFAAHQVCHMDVIVDGSNNFLHGAGKTTAECIYESDAPFGPYTCVKCGAQFDELTDMKDFERVEHFYEIRDHNEVINCWLKIDNWTEQVTNYIYAICRDMMNDPKIDRTIFYPHLVHELYHRYGIIANIIDEDIDTIRL